MCRLLESYIQGSLHLRAGVGSAHKSTGGSSSSRNAPATAAAVKLAVEGSEVDLAERVAKGDVVGATAAAGSAAAVHCAT